MFGTVHTVQFISQLNNKIYFFKYSIKMLLAIMKKYIIFKTPWGKQIWRNHAHKSLPSNAM